MGTKAETAAQEILETVPLVMRTLGSELRHSPDFPMIAHFRLLFMLKEGPHNLSELARKHNVSLPTMSNSVTTLVDRGWVRRTRSRYDRRQVVIELTDDGQDVLTEIQCQAVSTLEELLAPISENDLDQLLAGLAVLRSTFRVK